MLARTSSIGKARTALAVAGVVSVTALAGLVVAPAGAAPTFGSPVTLSSGGQSAGAPQVVVDAAGNAVAVWEFRIKGARHTVVKAAVRPAGKGWSRPVSLSSSGAQAAAPRVAINAAGDAVAVWSTAKGGKSSVQAAARPAGDSWSKAVRLSASGTDAAEPDVAVATDGTATAVWRVRGSSDAQVQWAFRPPPGGSWSVPISISAAGRTAAGPRVAVAGAGDAVVAWTSVGDTDTTVQAATRLAGGPFSSPAILAQSAGLPQVAVDHVGNAVVVWVQTRADDSPVQGAFRPARGTWSSPVDLSPSIEQAAQPDLAVNRNGDTVLAWTAADGAVRVATGSVWGGPWSAPVTLAGASRVAAAPHVAVDYGGRTVAVWQEGAKDAYTVRAANGSTRNGTWSEAATLATTGAVAPLPDVAVDPGGATVAVWARSKSGKVAVQAAAGAPAVALSPTTLTFPDTPHGSQSWYQAVTIHNTGNAVLYIGKVTLAGANPGDFFFVGSPCSGRDLAVQDSCTIALSFRPTATGARTAKLRINDNAAGSPHTVTLTGTGRP